MINLKLLSLEDIDDLVPRVDVYVPEMNVRRTLKNYCQGEPSLSFCIYSPHDGPIMAFGLNQLNWDGVYEAWAVTTDLVPKYGVSCTRTLRKALEMAFKRLRCHRIQATVLVDFKAGQEWLQALQFEKEGLMRNFGPDKSDYFLYARCN